MNKQVEQLRAEIERLKKENNGSPLSVCNDLLSFIDSIPVEPKFEVGNVVRSTNGTILTIIGLGQYCYHCDNDYSFGFNIQDKFELVEESDEHTHSVTKTNDQEEVDLNHEIEVYFQFWYDNESGGVIKPDRWLTQMDDLYAVARHFAKWQKKQIIGKACEWVRTHRDDDFFELVPEYNYCGAGNLNIDKMVEEFRKYLEEEL